jgi:hypothetical protein
MSIINDALKKTQMSFKRPKKKDQEQAQADPKPKEDGIVNVYEKMYKDREEQSKLSSGVLTPGKKAPKDSKKTSSKSREWLKTAFAALFLIASLSFAFAFLSNYEPLQDYIRSKTGKTRSSRDRLIKHMPKKRVYKDGDLVLNGISVIDGLKVALINDEIYKIGDKVDDKEITSINSDSVELRDDEKVFTITVR